jgi:23S rRNA (adenine2030-N6)-methyltransferase
VTLSVSAPSRDGFGMHGSGMFIVNPPWKLAETLRECLPYLARTLGNDGNGSFTLVESGGEPAATRTPLRVEAKTPLRPRARR